MKMDDIVLANLCECLNYCPRCFAVFECDPTEQAPALIGKHHEGCEDISRVYLAFKTKYFLKLTRGCISILKQNILKTHPGVELGNIHVCYSYNSLICHARASGFCVSLSFANLDLQLFIYSSIFWRGENEKFKFVNRNHPDFCRLIFGVRNKKCRNAKSCS